MKYRFSGELNVFINRAISGRSKDVDAIMEQLTVEASLATTRYIDFALSQVKTNEGIKRIEYYLFSGTLIQRNYASLFLNRLGMWEPVREAFNMGLIDEIQAFAR